MKTYIPILTFIFISCGNDFRPKVEEVEYPLSETIRPRTGDGIYPDTVTTILNGLMYIDVYHNEHLKEEKIYFESGSIFSHDFYFDGMLDSVCTSWYENGNKYSEVHYRKGQSHGKHLTWFKDGTIERDEYYENNQMITGQRVALDESNSFIEYVEILKNGIVVKIDSSLQGQPAEDWWSSEKPLEK